LLAIADEVIEELIEHSSVEVAAPCLCCVAPQSGSRCLCWVDAGEKGFSTVSVMNAISGASGVRPL
jgi:hypothetical protein